MLSPHPRHTKAEVDETIRLYFFRLTTLHIHIDSCNKALPKISKHGLKG